MTETWTVLGAALAALGLAPLLLIGLTDLDWRQGMGPQLAIGLAQLDWQRQLLMFAGAALLIAGGAILAGRPRRSLASRPRRAPSRAGSR